MSAPLSILCGSWIATLCLAAAMTRHQRDLFGQQLSMRVSRAARTAGSLFLLLTCVQAVRAWGWAAGISIWLVLAPMSAALTVLTITRMASQRARAAR